MRWRLLQRIAAVLAMLLAALLLGADAGEYPALSRAGLRALGRGVLPLLVVASLNLAALDGRRVLRALALVANLLFLGAVLRLVQAGAPPFVWISLAIGVLLVLSSSMRVAERGAIRGSAAGRDADGG